MNFSSKRTELIARMGVPRSFCGPATNATTGNTINFRGVDVSTHGFGCVIVGSVKQHDVLHLQMGGQMISFEVMWVESHLGIEHQFRVGLQCLDRMRDIRSHMISIGVALTPIDDMFAA